MSPVFVDFSVKTEDFKKIKNIVIQFNIQSERNFKKSINETYWYPLTEFQFVTVRS